MEIAILVISVLASLSQILQLLRDILRDSQQRDRNYQRIRSKLVDLRWHYLRLYNAAHNLIEEMCRINRSIPANMVLIGEVRISVADCVAKLDEIEDLTAIDEEMLFCLNALHRIKDGCHQFIKGITIGIVSLVFRSLGTIVATLGDTIDRLEKRYCRKDQISVPVTVLYPQERKILQEDTGSVEPRITQLSTR